MSTFTHDRTTAQLYALAVQRVEDTPELAAFADTIFYDWPNWREHLEWVCSAPVQDIIDWAEPFNAQ